MTTPPNSVFPSVHQVLSLVTAQPNGRLGRWDNRTNINRNPYAANADAAPGGKDETPIFKEVNRVEGVTPKELTEGVRERNTTWRSSHRKESQEQTVKRSAHEQSRPDYAKQHSMEPSL